MRLHMKSIRILSRVLILLMALLFARTIASGTNSPFYVRCSALRALLPDVAKDTACTLTRGSAGGSGMAVPVWVHSNSDASFWVTATPEAMADLVQKLKAEFEQAAAATTTKVATESETKQGGAGLTGFTLAFKTRTTYGSITVNTRPGNPGVDAAGQRNYVLDVWVKERGW